MDMVPSKLLDNIVTKKNFSINTNLSLIHSEVTILEKELDLIKRFDSNPEETRPLYGQSTYIVNIELIYTNLESGTSASILYNVLGERLCAGPESSYSV